MTFESIAALALVFGLLGGLRWWAGREPRLAKPSGPLQIEQRLALAPGHTLVVVRQSGRRLVIGCGPSGATLLAELTDRAAKASAAGEAV